MVKVKRMYCRNCKHLCFAEMAQEWQCWNDKSIHEGEEREDLSPACEKIESMEDRLNQYNKKLPCKVGDKIWTITSTANHSLGEYREVPLKHPQEKIQSITVTKNGLLYHVKDRAYSEQAFGKTVFLTREQAEQVLAEMKEV